MPWREGWAGDTAVCLVYLYEVPRTCIAVSFSNGAWAWIREGGTEQDMKRKHRWANIRHGWHYLKRLQHTQKVFWFFFCKFVISHSINEQSSVTPTGYTGISRNISFDPGGLFERLFLKITINIKSLIKKKTSQGILNNIFFKLLHKKRGGKKQFSKAGRIIGWSLKWLWTLCQHWCLLVMKVSLNWGHVPTFHLSCVA